MQVYRLVGANESPKERASPRRDVYSYFANIRRNREAKERFTNFLLRVHHFAESEKSVNRENAPWFRVIFAPAKIELGEAQEVFI